MGTRVAFIAQGVLQTIAAGETSPTLITSAYIQQQQDRIERERGQNAWKQNSMGWNLGAGAMMPQAAAATDHTGLVARFTAVAPGPSGQLLYALHTNHAGGLFSLDIARDEERRIFHRMESRAGDVTQHPTTRAIALSLQHPDGTAHIGLTGPTGGGLRQITEGDAFDAAPQWAPSSPDAKHGTLVYHSAGCARDTNGYMTHLGPAHIIKFDLDKDTHETLAEDSQFDLLSPKLLADGTLFFIRRPYQPFLPGPGPLTQLKNFILLPFRVLEGLAFYFRTYADLMQGKPLQSAGGPPRQGPNESHLLLWGRTIELEKQGSRRNPLPPRVPQSWQLIRRDATGKETILRTRVASFDIAPDGSIVTTDGSTIVLTRPDAAEQTLHTGKLIERVVACE